MNNSCVVEKQIEEILDKGIESKEDVFKILAWKMCAIDHKRSQAQGEIVYRSKVDCSNRKLVNRRGQVINVKEICDYVYNNREELSSESFEKIYSDLPKNKETRGIGTVYLAFISENLP